MHRAQRSLQQFFSLGICVTTLRRLTEGRSRHKPRTILVGRNAYVQTRVNCLLRIKRGPPSTSGPPRKLHEGDLATEIESSGSARLPNFSALETPARSVQGLF
jgi:hypothetical protein